MLKRGSYGRRTHSCKEERITKFRIRTASTQVTKSEVAELEHAAAERGLRLSECIRKVTLSRAA